MRGEICSGRHSKRPTKPGRTRTIWLPPLHRNSEILSLEEALDV